MNNAKFKKDDIVVDRFGTVARVVSVKWSCCSDTTYRLLNEKGHMIRRREHELNLKMETK